MEKSGRGLGRLRLDSRLRAEKASGLSAGGRVRWLREFLACVWKKQRKFESPLILTTRIERGR
ncbi:hypothetical protein IEQ34_002084 [Dendrobium chrysotoxum]|uniref:Uncharacterized protein n=1 Tax=Dendrobium chrysotoxum TaxID=161865 RepID=A0AAV7HIZ5_DENCH|nr:hypothetical protein IEQ34_002084 [Dendrobium chrysotoxum]